jgi:hypothetical protein
MLLAKPLLLGELIGDVPLLVLVRAHPALLRIPFDPGRVRRDPSLLRRGDL